ncbi:MAG: DUF4286 family protein [Bacteroidaceae bacterium]|nr:DUF4286 family protein [Bacteroidaceae bacterium]
MLIFNTTFQVSKSFQNSFLEWLKAEYIPLAIQSQILFNPLLSRVLSQEDIDGECYALQFHVHTPEDLNKWYEQYGKGLNEKLTKKFVAEVVGFSTVLQTIEI